MTKGALAAAVVAAGIIVSALPAGANMTGASDSTTGASCGGSGSSTDGDCRNSVGFSSACGILGCTAFTSRYAWNINADTGILSTHDTSGTARHTVNFTATAPGGYRLDITTTR